MKRNACLPFSSFSLHPSSLDSLAQRKAFLLRIDPNLLEQIQHWADDDLRSLNGQIEFLLRRAMIESGRARKELDSKPFEPSSQDPQRPIT
jgi:hypothetical protein